MADAIVDARMFSPAAGMTLPEGPQHLPVLNSAEIEHILQLHRRLNSGHDGLPLLLNRLSGLISNGAGAQPTVASGREATEGIAVGPGAAFLGARSPAWQVSCPVPSSIRMYGWLRSSGSIYTEPEIVCGLAIAWVYGSNSNVFCNPTQHG